MLKKKHRLNLRKEENAEIFQSGKSVFIKGEYFFLYGRDNNNFLRFSAVTPKRLFKTAVSRTKARSLLYSLMEEIMFDFKIDFSLKKDMVIVYRKQISRVDEGLRKTLKADLNKLLMDFLQK